MGENTSDEKSSEHSSVSFPFTSGNCILSNIRIRSRLLRYKPVRYDDLAKELLSPEESAHSHNNIKSTTTTNDLKEIPTSNNDEKRNESTDILNTTIIEDECSNHVMPELPKSNENKPILKPIEQNTYATPAKFITKPSIKDAIRENGSVDENNLRKNQHLLKTPIDHSRNPMTINMNTPMNLNFKTPHNHRSIASCGPKQQPEKYQTPVTKDRPRFQIPNIQQLKKKAPDFTTPNKQTEVVLKPEPSNPCPRKHPTILREQNVNTAPPERRQLVEESSKSTAEDNKLKQTKQTIQYSTPNPLRTQIPDADAGKFKSLIIRGKEYVVINKIGDGGSSKVYKCLEQGTLQDRAVKVVNLAVDSVLANGYINEVKMLRSLQGNDRVIKMFDFELVKKTLFVVMEKGDVDFSVFLRNMTTENQIPIHIIICYWIEMLKCVKEIHQNGIIHSDLKPSNFIIVGGRLKLIDFGIASSLSSDMTSVVKNFQVGTFNYISPEALLDSRENNSNDDNLRIRISYKSDVWSLGCILYQMIYKKTPFHNAGNTWTKIAVIIDKNHSIEYPAINGVPTYLIEMIKLCLIYEMKQRPTVDELLNMYTSGNYF